MEFITLVLKNKSIIDIANQVSKKTGSKIRVFKDKNDPRSYRLDSSKLINTGFRPKKIYKDAIIEIVNMYVKTKKIKN